MLRRTAPLLILAAGIVVVPFVVQKFSVGELRTAMPDLRAAPRALAPVEFQDASGNKITADRFRGQVVLLNFWATWCAPCKAEMPSLNALASHFPKGLAVVPVSVDAGIGPIRRYYSDLKLDRLPIYSDPLTDAMRALGVIGIPTTLLLDREGREIARLIGPAQWDSPAMIEGFSRLIGDAPSR
jgi:thiol-disulfide isomerase/thioredoxin